MPIAQLKRCSAVIYWMRLASALRLIRDLAVLDNIDARLVAHCLFKLSGHTVQNFIRRTRYFFEYILTSRAKNPLCTVLSIFHAGDWLKV